VAPFGNLSCPALPGGDSTVWTHSRSVIQTVTSQLQHGVSQSKVRLQFIAINHAWAILVSPVDWRQHRGFAQNASPHLFSAHLNLPEGGGGTNMCIPNTCCLPAFFSSPQEQEENPFSSLPKFFLQKEPCYCPLPPPQAIYILSFWG
jgi:hypothetical protein